MLLRTGLLVILAVVILVLLPCRRALAWGAGHIGQAKLVHRVLPEDMVQRISDQTWANYEEHYCEYPDSQRSDLGDTTKDLPQWRYFTSELRSKHIEDIHGVEATMPAFFSLMVDCFRRGEMEQAMVWAGCITHLLGDTYACNHWPLAEMAVYQYAGGDGWSYSFRKPGVPMGAGMWVDLGDSITSDLGKEELRLLAGYKPQLRGKTLDEAAVNLCVARYTGAFKVESLDPLMMETAEQAVDKGERGYNGNPQGMKVLARVGAACTKDAADFIYTAYVLARTTRQTVNVQRDRELAGKKANQLQAARTLKETPYYAGLLDRPAGPAVGVIVCTLGGTGEACGGMGTGSVYWSAAVLRTLKQRAIPYRAMQADRPETWDLNPAHTPIVIARQLEYWAGFDPEKGNGALAQYLAKGGKILYLGGGPAPYLKTLNAAVQNTGDQQYALPGERTQEAKIIEAAQLGARQYTLGFNMAKNWFSGGYILRAPWRFRSRLPSTVVPLVQMKSGAETAIIAAGEKDPKGGLRTAMAPLFIFYPGAFDPQRTIHSLSHPVLDNSNGQMLVSLLKALDSPKRIKALHR